MPKVREVGVFDAAATYKRTELYTESSDSKNRKITFLEELLPKRKKSTTNPKAPHDLYDQRDISAFSPGKIKSFRDTNVT